MATIKQLNSYKNIIIKIGSSLIVDESGSIREEWLNSLVQDIANLKKNSKNVIIVTSGAIALGKNILNLKIHLIFWGHTDLSLLNLLINFQSNYYLQNLLLNFFHLNNFFYSK